eukprot:Blabericola_migrator_1__4569@NODE_242_length_10949_cov_37_670281_g204_i0_p9_GENE_NODE_242_length_10949_cov_37_670281_g204_i0NODE_242_length_10949_cov_37_670281_g204_i0_p9_ORF_typecomplete_len155_score30_25PAC4/PF16093_5/0_00078_NODE_242_length_10949_cov_37_670281_g204_i01043110895
MMMETTGENLRLKVLPPTDKGVAHVVYMNKYSGCVLVYVGQVGQPHRLPVLNSLVMAAPHYKTSLEESPVTTLVNGVDDDDARSLCSRIMAVLKIPLLFAWNIGDMYEDERLDFHATVAKTVVELFNEDACGGAAENKTAIKPCAAAKATDVSC